MRDIRSDLQERVGRMEERIKAAHAQCEEKVKQAQDERDAKVAGLKAAITMIAKLVEFEEQDRANTPRGSSQLSLADFLERKLNEIGPMSKDDLYNLAIKDGYFRDIQSAAQTVEPTLFGLACEKRVRTLPDGTFTIPMRSPVELKRVV